MFSYLHSPTPEGRGRAERGGDSQASNSCISHGTAAVRASWEQCPARGNRSNTRDWWERSSPCWPGTDRELLPAPAPQEGIAAAAASQSTLPSPCSRGLHSLLSLPGCGLWFPSYGSIPIPYPSLSASDLLSGQCSWYQGFQAGSVQKRTNAGDKGQQHKWRKGFKGLQGREDHVSDGVGQARLDLGLSFGFLRSGSKRGRWK